MNLKNILNCLLIASILSGTGSAQSSEINQSERLSALPLDSKRGAFQNTKFEAFDIAKEKLNMAYIQKAKEEIVTLKRVLKTTKNKNQRSNTQHRLAEVYWEVERTIYLRKMDLYQKNMTLYGQKKISTKPRLPTFSGQNTYNYYNQILKTNPKYTRLDEVLFYAGYRGRDANQKNYHKYLIALVKKFPRSTYSPDAYFRIGEYYFDNRNFNKAIDSFNQILKTPNKLHNTAMYKVSWCYFNQHKFGTAKKVMQKVVKNTARVSVESDLRKEALRDLVLIYSELGEFVEADKYFTSIGEPEYAVKVLEQLSDIYFDQARYDLAIKTISLLLKKVPYSPNAPKYHSKLIDCFDRSQRLTTAMKEMNRFLASYDPSARWHRQNNEKEVRSYAHNRSEVYARFLATRYHEESQDYEEKDPKKSENFALTAMGFYKKYFERFSDHPKAYDLRLLYAELLFQYKRYELAALQYGTVVKQKPRGPRAKEALTGQIDALSKVETIKYKKVQEMAQKKKAKQETLPLPDTTKSLIKANILYAKLFPKDAAAPTIYFQHALLFYNYNHFNQALKGFDSVIGKYSRTEPANKSRHLILDIHNIKKDWAAVEKTALSYLKVSTFGPKNKALLLDLVQGSIFQQAKDIEKKKDYVAAAQKFESLVSRYPSSKYADKALFNASLNYIKADKASQAIAASNKFLRAYPNSDLAPELLVTFATYFDQKLDYKNTATYYELYVTRDPKSKAAPDALYNAAVYREKLGSLTKALNNYKKHASLYPNSPDRQTVLFAQATILEKQKQYSAAAKAYETFINFYGKKSPKAVEAAFKMSENYNKSGQTSRARASLQQAVDLGKRFSSSEDSVHYQSMAQMALLEGTFKQYQGITLEMPQQVLERNLAQKYDLLKTLKKEYLKVVKSNDPQSGVEALYKLGLCYQDFSQSLFSAPIPTNLSPEEVQIYQAELQNQALPIEEQAIESFENALIKSQELRVYTDTAKKAYTQLTQYKPKKYPPARFPLIKNSYVAEPWSFN